MRRIMVNLEEERFLDDLLKNIKNQIDIGNYKPALLLSEIYKNIRGVSNGSVSNE